MGMGMGEGMGVSGGVLEEPGIEDRIATMADYIFGDSIGIPLAQRSRQILAAVGEGVRRFVEVKRVVRVDLRTEIVAKDQDLIWEGEGVEVGEEREEREEREEEDGRESLFVSEMAFGAFLAELNWEGGAGWG